MLIKPNEGDLPQPALALGALCLKDILKVNRCNLSFCSIRKTFSSNASVLRTIYKGGVALVDCRKEELWPLQKKESRGYMKFCLKSFSPQTETAPGETIHRNFLPVGTEPTCHQFFQEQYSFGTQWGCGKVICQLWIRPSHSCNRFGSASRTHPTKMGWTAQGSSNTGGT